MMWSFSNRCSPAYPMKFKCAHPGLDGHLQPPDGRAARRLRRRRTSLDPPTSARIRASAARRASSRNTPGRHLATAPVRTRDIELSRRQLCNHLAAPFRQRHEPGDRQTARPGAIWPSSGVVWREGRCRRLQPRQVEGVVLLAGDKLNHPVRRLADRQVSPRLGRFVA
jgi:hypothetical protein